ncbi:hypothetical protein IFR04_001793 [Cadophora malorum]|uniref:Ankyrin n=1 Tax=Cadophora malorum TaxID=108018 RepID=A0A8H7WHG2_9HELO|nr:hypothetical protein IFR04_001793 [Cadophora malorum]
MIAGHSGIVSKLLSAGAGSPLDNTIYELYECGRKQDIEKAQTIINIGIGAAHLLDAFPTEVPKNKARVLARNIVSTFLAVCAEPGFTGPKYGKSALCIAVEVGQWDLAQTLIRRGANLDSMFPERGSILQVLLSYWHGHQHTRKRGTNAVKCIFKMMELMLSTGADSNGPVVTNVCYANTILELALWWGEGHASEFARLLLGYGARVDGNEHVIAAAIMTHCDIDVIRRLLDDGAVLDPPLECFNPLQAAITELQNEAWPFAVDVIKLLLKRGTNVNAPPAEVKNSPKIIISLHSSPGCSEEWAC